jgi:hypothetical protein
MAASKKTKPAEAIPANWAPAIPVRAKRRMNISLVTRCQPLSEKLALPGNPEKPL